MKRSRHFSFHVDKQKKQIHVTHIFDAPRAIVWYAWTTAAILDLWWAPKPWITKTKTMVFSDGGHWHYAMIGPAGETHWSITAYAHIVAEHSFSAVDRFCDAEGKTDLSLPCNSWDNNFSDQDAGTLVTNNLQFDSLADLDKTIAMGFKEGFSAALMNLEHYLSTMHPG